MFEIEYYQTPEARRPLIDWLEKLRDRQARGRILARIDRLALGNFGDHHALDGGIHELRIDWGPGYRVYFAKVGRKVVLLLCGGDKKTQQVDIVQARRYLNDYVRRTDG
jgi:putative addiction module killer protein